MGGLVAAIKQWVETTFADGDSARELTIDPQGASGSTAQAMFPSGYDAQGFPEDYAVVVDIGGGKVSVAYLDPKLSHLAGPGEVVIVSRSAPGIVAAKLHLKSNGTVSINGVEITKSGELKAPGEISAMNSTAPVKLSTHMHPTAMGPSGSPTPGT